MAGVKCAFFQSYYFTRYCWYLQYIFQFFRYTQKAPSRGQSFLAKNGRIVKKICTFKGLEHRLEYIGKSGKTKFYNGAS